MNRQTSPDFEPRDDWTWSMIARPIEVTAEDEREFQIAMKRYKDVSGRQFPTWSEVFEVLRSLGYAKRIWKPVVDWVPISSSLSVNDPAEMNGWYASAETSVMP